MSTGTDYVTFALGQEKFGVDASAVDEIVWLPELTAMEEVPEFIAGVFDLRGRIVPAMDLNLRFGHAPTRYRLSDNIIVLRRDTGGGQCGVIVSDVLEVVSVDPDEIAAPATPHAPHLIAGEARIGEQIVMLLNLDNLLRDTELETDEETAPEGKPSPRLPHPGFGEATSEETAHFHERALELARPPGGAAEAEQMTVAVFRLDGELFGVELGVVREFAEARNVSPVPCTPQHVVGNMNLRGEILTLIDLRRMLNVKATQESAGAKVVVVKVKDVDAGLAVEEVVDVLSLNPSRMQPAPAAMEGKRREYITGEVMYLEKPVSIIDLEKVLTSAESAVDEEA